MSRSEIARLYPIVHGKNQVLGTVFGGVFFGLLPAEPLTAFILSEHLAINFLPDKGFSAF